MYNKKTVSLFLFSLFLLSSCITKADPATQALLDSLYFSATCTKAELNKVKIIESKIQKKITRKKWTIMVYISADNDLARFAIRNIKQMAQVGSNENFNIVVQLDICKAGNQKVTRRYYIEKGKILHLNADDPSTQKMDSGDPETLVSFCKWATKNFIAEQYGLILWDHGSGILDPEKSRTLRPEEFIVFNHKTQRLQFDRSIGYIDRMTQRGMCWDESTGNYLSNQDLDYALNKICTDLLDGKKLLFIGFDACLMQMVEVANIMKNYANIMIGSEESIIGYGWPYEDILKPFKEKSLEPIELAEHIVDCFKTFYERITDEHILSAIDLDTVHYVEENINTVALLLIEGLKEQKDSSVKKTIRASRNRMVCTSFDEPSYIDLHHFYTNLMSNIKYIKLKNEKLEENFKKTLYEALDNGKQLIEFIVFSHASGKDFEKAHGLSIFFPERGIHPSYGKTLFAQENEWINFLSLYLSM